MERHTLGFRVDRDFGKQGEDRGPTIRPHATSLKKLVQPHRDHRGPICPATGLRLYKLLVADRMQAGILEWPSNALRHSFASYHLAALQNPSELSLEMGNTSPGLLFRHYRELVTPDAAAKWWSIMPAAGDSIVAITA